MMDATVTTDQSGREWILIGDDRARRLTEWKRSHWTEIHGVGHGHTPNVGPSSLYWAELRALHELDANRGSFIAGASYDVDGGTPELARELLVSTCGVSARRSANTTRPTLYSLQG